MILEQGERDGFDAGYADGLDLKPKSPSPPLAPSLASDAYLPAFIKGYDIGHVQGVRDCQQIIDWRANADIHQRDAEATMDRDHGDV